MVNDDVDLALDVISYNAGISDMEYKEGDWKDNFFMSLKWWEYMLDFIQRSN